MTQDTKPCHKCSKPCYGYNCRKCSRNNTGKHYGRHKKQNIPDYNSVVLEAMRKSFMSRLNRSENIFNYE